jgi:hypothetical protein
MPSGFSIGWAYDIAVTTDGTVYTVGSYEKGDVTKPCYWRGTTRIDIPSSGNGGAYAIAIAR